MGFQSFKVLFLCEHNSARSIMAEALLNRLGAGRFEAYSAGIAPAPSVSPYVMSVLQKINYTLSKLSPKPVEAMLTDDAPVFDFVFRLSHHLPADGHWPDFKGAPMVIDWFLPDPSDLSDSKSVVAQAYGDMFARLSSRIDTLSQMSDEALKQFMPLRGRLERMGEEAFRLAS
jgi:arsenate reductase